MTEHTLDTPENIAEARRRIEHHVARYRRFITAASERGDDVAAARWNHVARCIERDLLGNGGCVIAAFDERTPEVAALIATADGIDRQPEPATITVTVQAEGEKVVDLMAALEASVVAAKDARRRHVHVPPTIELPED